MTGTTDCFLSSYICPPVGYTGAVEILPDATSPQVVCGELSEDFPPA